MENSSKLMTLAMCLYALSLVEYTPAFVPPAAGSAPAGSLRGTMGAGASASEGLASISLSGLRTAAAFVAVSAATMSVRGSNSKAQTRTQRKSIAQADPEGWRISDMFEAKPTQSPVLVYSAVLNNAAMKMKEAVPVAQDMMAIKKKLQDKHFLCRNVAYMSTLDALSETIMGRMTVNLEETNAEKWVNVLGPFQSTVVPKFIKFLGKKRRLEKLLEISVEYINDLYKAQDIAPVLVKSRTELTAEQKAAITDKMKAKIGASDIKLVTQLDKTSNGGFSIFWNFMDPDELTGPQNIYDSTLNSYVQEKALNEGVTTPKSDGYFAMQGIEKLVGKEGMSTDFLTFEGSMKTPPQKVAGFTDASTLPPSARFVDSRDVLMNSTD